MAPHDIDPNAWADAFIKAFNGGGWAVPVLSALLIVCRWPPWRGSRKVRHDTED